MSDKTSFTTLELAEYLGVHADTIRHWARTGQLRAWNSTKSKTHQRSKLRFLMRDVEAFIESRRVGPPPRRRPKTLQLPKVEEVY